MPAAIRTLALVVNMQKSGAPELAEALLAAARNAGVDVRVTHDFPVAAGFLENCDACCVIGGDGTLLGVAAEAARENVPIIGVNRGALGFLTTFAPDEARELFPALLAGEFQIAHRSMLRCAVSGLCAGEPALSELTALNDIVIKDERNSHLVRLEVYADDELITDYYSDGLIFTTPTGSTAYNLSAGGPLIHPSADVIAMTPICPHTLSNRSIIFRNGVELRVHNKDPQARLLVAADGRQNPLVCGDNTIAITLSPWRLPLVQRHNHSHFSVVRQKLKWNGGRGAL